jgi:L-asparaginase II
MSNPVLVELTRGGLVESVHRGALALARPNGELVAAVGEVAKPVYPRSAIKAFQTLAMIETGAADHFGFADREIALMSASHSGTADHVALAASMLARAGHGPEALGCGAHVPMGDMAGVAFHRAGDAATALHNNCSGKHAGMVAACAHCAEPVQGYWEPAHPHQQRIRRVLSEFSGADLGAKVVGVDGCSAPNWAMPLAGTARAFAQFISGEGAARHRRAAVERIAKACWAAPDMVAGPGRLDTAMMSELPGKVFMKTGAEGVYCGAFPALGLGFAVKIDDGNGRASEAVTREIVARLVPGAEHVGGSRPLTNWRGIEVGRIGPAEPLEKALSARSV